MKNMGYTNYASWAQARAEANNNNLQFNDPAPLLDLDQNQYNYGSFMYPMDLGAPAAGKDHFIVFHINETTTTQFPAKGKVAQGQLPRIVQNGINDKQKGLGTSIYVPKEQQGEKNDKDPNGDGTQGKQGGQAERSMFDVTKQPITRIPTTIILYMPSDIQVAYRADWEAVELGAAADLTNKLKGTTDWDVVMKSLGASGVKAAAQALNQFTGMSMGEALSRQGRLSINPHQEVIFNGIGFRTFNFSFRFTPESEDEAVNVDNIIRAFKFYAAPEILRGTAGRFWIYPAEFDIQYYSNGQENLFLNKISTCALTDMQINFTASGQWSAHRPHSLIKGAPPVCTDIQLTFKELEIMTKQRILEGY